MFTHVDRYANGITYADDLWTRDPHCSGGEDSWVRQRDTRGKIWQSNSISLILESTCPISHETPLRTEMCIFLFCLGYLWNWSLYNEFSFENILEITRIVFLFKVCCCPDNNRIHIVQFLFCIFPCFSDILVLCNADFIKYYVGCTSKIKFILASILFIWYSGLCVFN